jgi:hypothetical protein
MAVAAMPATMMTAMPTAVTTTVAAAVPGERRVRQSQRGDKRRKNERFPYHLLCS